MKNKITILIIVLLSLSDNSRAQSEIFGVSIKGGSGSVGNVYKTSNSGLNQTSLHHFVTDYQGDRPVGDLIKVGNELVGFTSEGGINNLGVLFKYNIISQVYTKLVDFNGTSNGANPTSSLLLASNGLLYGVTTFGGLNNGGVLFSYNLTTSVFTKLHDFTFVTGIEPIGGLVEQTPGVLYGLASRGGVTDDGVIFSFTIGTGIYLKLHDFNTPNGENPGGSLIATPSGYLLGTTSVGGLNGLGTIFGYRASTSTFTKHYDFTPASGNNPQAGLLYNQANAPGVCFGFTRNGGVSNQGSAFKIDTSGTNFTKIYDFNFATGGHPEGTPAFYNGSTLIGTSFDGGPSNYGVIFSMDFNGAGYSVLSVLDFFTIGANSRSGFVYDGGNSYYTLTSAGGSVNSGTMIKIDASGQNTTTEFSFNAPDVSGGLPFSSLIKSQNGKVYGATTKGGVNASGVVYELDAQGGNFQKVADFNNASGNDCRGSLLEVGSDLFIGLSYGGGSFNFGSLFEVDASGALPVVPTQKIAFSSALGTYPSGGLIKANNGRIYGLTTSGGDSNQGVLFEYVYNTNSYLKRKDFVALADGSSPMGDLVQAANGAIYGVANSGGVNGGGTIFRYNPLDSSFSKVHDFSNLTGVNPMGGLTYNPANNLLYGLTNLGGANSRGVLYSFNPSNNQYVVLHSFNGIDGEYPVGKLLLSDNGRLYGTTQFGGSVNLGVYFEYNIGTSTYTKLFDFASTNGAEPNSELLLMNCNAPQITLQPLPLNACPNNQITFSVNAIGSGLNYRWYKDGVLLPGQTLATLTLNNVTVADNGRYHCAIYNTCGWVVSQFAQLQIVNRPPANIINSGPPTFCEGQLNSVLSTSFNPAYSYQWYIDGSPISNAILANYGPVNQSGNYTVQVSSGVGCDSLSAPYLITVVPNSGTPVISITASTDLICGPEMISFTADTTGVGASPFCYWKKNGIINATGPNLLTYSSTLQNNDQVQLELTPNLCPSDQVFSNTVVMIDTCAVLTINILDAGTSNGSYCAGQPVQIAYQSSSNFFSTNILTVQLSGANGSFASPTNIGTLATVNSTGVINCIIPSAALAGSQYRVRVISSSPSNTGADNGFDIYLSPQNFGLSYTVSPGAALTAIPLAATFTNTTPNSSAYSFDLYFGDGTFIPNAPSVYEHVYINNGAYQTAMVGIDLQSGCSDTLYDPSNSNHNVIANASNATSCNIAINVSPNGIVNACQGGQVQLNCATPASIYQWSRNGVILPGQNTNQINVTQAGFYSITLFDANGCPNTSNPVQVLFNNPAPALPVISLSGSSTNGCGSTSGTLNASGNFSSYLWNTGQVANSINITSAGTYFVIGQGATGCDAQSLPFNVSGNPIPIPEICVVTTTDDDAHHVIVWDRPLSLVIDSIYVFKDVLNNEQFVKIASVGYDDLSEYIDLSSNPSTGSRAYALASKDICGGVTALSAVVRPMFLQVLPNIGVKRWLNWNQYIGQSQNTTEYVIFRGADLQSLARIDSVDASVNGYLDSPPGLNFIYRVLAKLDNDCESTRAPHRGSVSNGVGNILIGTPDGMNELTSEAIEFNIIPNPNNGLFKLSVSNAELEPVFRISVIDLMGREVYSANFDKNKSIDINLSHLDNGIYLVRLFNVQLVSNKRLLITK
jgi:uncharacterized repeat protein (TIGR03803 family)